MSITVQIHPLIRHLTNNQRSIEVDGKTVGQCLENLITRFPETRDWLLKEGGLNTTVELYVNGENIFPEGLTRPVKDNDTINMLIIISGG